ncbi:MAG: protein translocase subunit SecF [Polyangiaceae bacterium]
MEFFPHHKTYDFMKMRAFWVSLSLFLTFSSLALYFIKKPNWGTDFRGGTEVELAFKKSISAAEVREACHKAGLENADVVQVSDANVPNHFLIRSQEVSDITDAKKAAIDSALCWSPTGAELPADRCPVESRPSEIKFSPGGDKIALRYESEPNLAAIAKQVTSVEGVELRPGETNPQIVSARDHKVEIALKSRGDQLVDGLVKVLGADVAPSSALRVEWVGPKAGKQLRDAAIKSVAIAIVFIMAYVSFRFDLRFAPGGVIALVHDSMVVIGVFVLFQREITLSTIAAILTIVGYSIADTVIVYDRIRENLGKHRGKTFAQVINISVSETLSRTVLTSGTVLLSISAFFFFGTGVIKDFALALVVGIVAGTYSSIYVAAPFTEWVDRRFFSNAMSNKPSGGDGKPKRKFTARPASSKSGAVVLPTRGNRWTSCVQ